MGEEQRDSVSKTVKVKSLRPALIASEKTVCEYSMFLEHLLVGLADESIRPILVCPPNCDVDSVVSGTVEVVRHPAFKLPLMGRQNRKILVERLEKFKPTVIHCLCESKTQLARQLARQLDLPYVLTVNSLQKRYGQLSISSRRCAKIVVPAKSVADNLAKVYPKFAERIEQINIGTFVEDSCGCFCEPGRLASMVTTGPLRNVSELENLFGAVKHLAINGYEFMLVVISNEGADKGLRKLLSALGLLQIVTVVPRLQPRRLVLAAGDIFIVPYQSTAFNPLLLEAMSVGAAVASCKGGVDDLIIEDKTSVVFDPDDELSIRGSLQRLLDRRELARQLAREAQTYLRENHSVSKMISAILRIYREAQNRLKR